MATPRRRAASLPARSSSWLTARTRSTPWSSSKARRARRRSRATQRAHRRCRAPADCDARAPVSGATRGNAALPAVTRGAVTGKMETPDKRQRRAVITHVTCAPRSSSRNRAMARSSSWLSSTMKVGCSRERRRRSARKERTPIARRPETHRQHLAQGPRVPGAHPKPMRRRPGNRAALDDRAHRRASICRFHPVRRARADKAAPDPRCARGWRAPPRDRAAERDEEERGSANAGARRQGTQ